ncbi:MAG: hypothetical protein EOO51_12575 [Flavobacterium sp.]|nr:MAG: hypothetical protein EOO51_12575 [Flavobacterium sp.]
MASLAEINIKFTADLRGFSTEMQKSLRIIGKVGDDMQKLGKTMSLYVTAPLLAAGGAAIKFASDYNESLNKVDVAFGGASDQVKEFAKASLENFGIAEGSALDMAALFGDMATSMGLPVDKAAAMSKSLVGLAGDLASFKNIGIDEATTALNGVFTGETESLKRLGVVMTEANLQAFALSQGIQTNIKDMSQADKVTLRYAYVMNQTKNAQGDFARTGGGAANQMRIFQESLKQVAAQFGQVLLPAFTKMITGVNGVVKSLSSLSDNSKTTILVVAGIAAAIGPVLAGFGSLLTLIPNTISKLNGLKDNLIALQALLLANPFTALAVGLTAIASIALISNSRFTALTDAKEEFNKISTAATGSIAKESAELNKNLAIAKNKTLSDQQRKQAIEEINSTSKEFLGNITLENLYTQQTTDAVKAYNGELLKKARIQAANEKLVEVEKKILDLMTGQTDAVKPSVWQNLWNVMRSGGNIALEAALAAETVGKNFSHETTELVKLRSMLVNYISTNSDVVKSNNDVKVSLDGLTSKSGFKSGTVAAFEAQIDMLQKLQKEIPTTNADWQKYQDQIDAIQKKVDQLTGKTIILPKYELPEFDASAPKAFSLADLKDELAYFEKLRETASTTAEEYDYYTTKINNTKVKISAIEGVDEFKASTNDIKTSAVELGSILSEQMQQFNESLVTTFATSLAAIASGTGGMKGLFNGLLGLVGDFLVSLGKALVQVGIASQAFKKAFVNPYLAIGVGAALIAFGTIFKSLITQGPGGGGGGATAFANGGIVYGPVNALVGEYSGARSNPEIIAPLDKLKSLIGDTGSVVSVNVGGEIEIDGHKLRLVLNRADAQNNRLGL